MHATNKFDMRGDATARLSSDATNVNGVPGYVRCDAFVEYALGAVNVQLNAFNLFDRKYYEGVYSGHVVPGTTRSAQLRLEYGF